jgi:hypothetical protein
MISTIEKIIFFIVFGLDCFTILIIKKTQRVKVVLKYIWFFVEKPINFDKVDFCLNINM